MGLLSDLRSMIDGGGAAAELERLELGQAQRVLGENTPHAQATAIGPKIRRRYRFVGSVQGVGFRWTTTNLATSVGATGWVMNELDGSVSAEIQGTAEQVNSVVDGLDRYYNGRRYLGGFRIESASEVDVIDGERDFRPIY